ncbi:Uncharacterised protein [Mycobacteroides abscessus subsp. abscessus]|nr:Uncharacterised protein [Mycobacteroides abscessus subsp. abscessus]
MSVDRVDPHADNTIEMHVANARVDRHHKPGDDQHSDLDSSEPTQRWHFPRPPQRTIGTRRIEHSRLSH